MKSGVFRYALMLGMLLVLALAHPAVGGEKDEEKQAAQAYKEAYKLLLDKEYAKARNQFAKIVKDYNDSRVYDDARYWYCYAMKKSTEDIEKAFECYREFLEEFPDSKWREEALENAVELAKRLARTDPKYNAWMKKLGDHIELGIEDEEFTFAILVAILESGDEEMILGLLDKTDNTDVRRRIVHVLADCESPACLEKLAGIAVSDPDTDVRRIAVFALGECETMACMERLVEIAKSDPDTDVRRTAIYALSEFDDEEAVIKLMIEILETETDTDIRRHAVYIIADAEDPTTVPTLIEIALNDKDRDTARAAVYGLTEVDEPRAIEALSRLLKESTDADIKRAALYALVDNEDVSMLPTFKEIALSEKDRDLIMPAVYAIAEMDDEPEAARILIEVFKKSNDADVRKAALYGIAENDHRELGVELLKQAALSTDDEELSKIAIYALEDVLEDEDAGLLLEIYEKTPSAEVRRATVHILLEIGVDEAMPVIKKVLKTEVDPNLRAEVLWALEEADDEDEAVKILADVAKNDPSSRVRRAAVRVLGEIDTDEARKALMEILRERSKKKDKD